MNDNHTPKPHPIVTVLFFAFLLTFFGGGLLLFINLFVPFLPEAAFAIVALVVGAMFLVLLIVGKCVQVITALRRATKTTAFVDAESTGTATEHPENL